MTLRARLLLASAMVLGIVAVGAVVLIRTQRTYLTDQIDEQLDHARPLVDAPIPPGRVDVPEDGGPPDAPISDLYIGLVDDGELVTVIQGQLLDDVPLVEVDALDRATSEPFTVVGQAGSTRFRVAVVQPLVADTTAVVALPLDEVDSAVGRLTWMLVAGTAVIGGVLLVAVWWVERLGLRPIARITAVADAIAAGERGHRVDDERPRTEAGKLATAFNVMLDERDRTEERLRRFVADASHELRTPLTSIRGYLDLYQDGGFRDDGQLDDMVRRMAQESTRMQDLVEDLLLLARLDQRRPLRAEVVELATLLRDAASDAHVLQPARPLAVDLPDDDPLEVIGDGFRLQQVVTAVVDNALAYTDMSVPLRLGAHRLADRSCVVTLADDGPGLDADDATRAFDRFFRSEQSRSRRAGGAGLGLAIAKSIIEAHAGTIALRTAPGRGCEFTIHLPANAIENHSHLW